MLDRSRLANYLGRELLFDLSGSADCALGSYAYHKVRKANRQLYKVHEQCLSNLATQLDCGREGVVGRAKKYRMHVKFTLNELISSGMCEDKRYDFL